MELNMSIIADHLSHFRSVLQIKESLKLNLTSAKILNPLAASFELGYVYVGISADVLATPNIDLISALICVGDISKNELLSLTEAEFMIIKSTDDFSEVFNAVQDIFDRHNSWEVSLNTAIINKKSLQDLLNISYELMNNPIALLDTAQICLAKSGNLPANYEQTVWLDLINLGYVSVDRFTAYDKEYLDYLVNSKEAYLIKGPHHNNHNQIIANIRINDMRIANLGMVDIVHPFTYGQLCLVKYVASVFGVAIKTNRIDLHAVTNFDYIVLNFISGNAVNRDVVQFHLSGRNWKLDDPYYLIVLDPFNLKATGKEADTVIYYDYLINVIRQTIPGSIVLRFKDHIMVIMREHINGESFEDVQETLERTLKKINCQCGISTRFEDFSAIHDYYQQAVSALTLGRLVDENEYFFHYSNYFLDHVLELCSNNINISMLCHPEVIKLNEHDFTYHSDYVTDLFTYLTNSKSITKAAEKLFVHRNTFMYRLNKILDILAVDLTNESSVLHIIISCMIIKRHQTI